MFELNEKNSRPLSKSTISWNNKKLNRFTAQLRTCTYHIREITIKNQQVQMASRDGVESCAFEITVGRFIQKKRLWY